MSLPLGRTLLATVLTALALLMVPSAANPAGEIVIYGAHSGSHMEIYAKGDRIVVKGFMANTRPQGCHLVRRTKAVCRADNATAMQIVMGPSGDFVRINDPIPVPVTAYLGFGGDKFIGSSERDTCFGQGTKKNRCVGKGGNDVCITGPRNSDCIGNGGDDYCRHSTGSDGCWGGPGNDVCYMGPGKDGCHGEEGNDRLYAGADPDQLYGGPGNDYCDGRPGWGHSTNCERGPQR